MVLTSTSAGGYYSSTDDLLAFASGILGNKALCPVKTRKWLKPQTSTSAPGFALGHVWEIYRSDNLTSDGRLVEIYTKSGDIGNYHSMTVLIPDYDVTAAIILGGNETFFMAQEFLSLVVTRLLPGLEAAGKDESKANFVGTYYDAKSNSTFKLALDDGPGLVVQNWTVRGVNVLARYQSFSPLSSASGPPKTASARLYPTILQSATQQSWRTVFDTSTPAERKAMDGSVFWAGGSCLTWAALDRTSYQYKGLDEVVFTLKNGSATSLLPRAFQVDIPRTGN